MNIGLKSKGLYRYSMCVIVVLIALSAAPVMAVDVAFHGYMEANAIVRDLDGFQQGGYFNDARLIQQRNVLKFDVDAYINKPIGPFVIDKTHLTYRGAVDTIFNNDSRYDVMDEWQDGRFNYGKADINRENDLREAFVDITYDGTGYGFFRPGRQIVSWGEVSGATIIDRINPLDGSFTMSSNPDDLKTPLWMGRLNYSIPPKTGFNLNFDLLWIPDVQPTQLAPLDESMAAPYISNGPFAGFSQMWMNPFFEGIKQDDSHDKDEWAAKVTGDFGANLSVSGYYLTVYEDNPAVLMTKMVSLGGPFVAPNQVDIEHPYTTTYGASFNYYVAPVDFVLKGEFGYTEDAPIALAVPDMVVPAKYSGSNAAGIPYLPFDLQQYRLKNTFNGMIGIDKAIWARWFSNSQLNTGFQWIRSTIIDIDPDMLVNNDEDVDMLSFLVAWDWFNGKIAPSIFCMYDTRGTWMTNVAFKYTMTPNWYFKFGQLAFLGDRTENGKFATLIGGDTYDANSQVTLTLGYQW
jgi:hypothetical protein